MTGVANTQIQQATRMAASLMASGDGHSRKDTPGVHRPDPHMIVVHFAHNVDVWEREFAYKLAGGERAKHAAERTKCDTAATPAALINSSRRIETSPDAVNLF